MKFGKKKFVEMLKFYDLWDLEKKGAILSFVQSGNHEISSLTGFEPGTSQTLPSIENASNFLPVE